MRIKVPVCEMEIDVEGKTIWIHSPLGATVLRIKCWSGIELSKCTDNPVTHFDLNIGLPPGNTYGDRGGRVGICLGPDAVEE
jgi:hypothetical protein